VRSDRDRLLDILEAIEKIESVGQKLKLLPYHPIRGILPWESANVKGTSGEALVT
jgi:hypothetical protein